MMLDATDAAIAAYAVMLRHLTAVGTDDAVAARGARC